MFELYEYTIIRSFYTACTMLSLIGAIYLFLRSRHNRARRFHACSMLLLCIWYIFRMLGFFPGGLSQGLGIMNAWVIIAGMIALLVLSLYPVEIIRPGWLTGRRSFLLSLPALGSVMLFLVGTRIEGEGITFLEDWHSLWSRITMFNVWTRFLMMGAFFFYFLSVVKLIFREDARYCRWRKENLPAYEANINDFWLRNYGYWFILILFGYLYIVFFVINLYALLFHNIIVQSFLLYSFYKVLFYDNPYREDFYLSEKNIRKNKEADPAIAGSFADSGERNFNAKLISYKQEIESWFEQERPYLQEDFRLKDVSDRFLLNRSYVSRIFNEGYGKSFSLVVRDYRLREAERLLLEDRECSVSQVAERCGFASSSSFIRTFVAEHDGVTPGRYRDLKKSQEN